MAYTTIDDPSAHFITTLHTGDGTSPKSITNSANSGDFQPDLIWAKGRSTAYEHQLSDSSRGTSSSNGLASNTSNAEGFFSSTYGYVSSFDSNGFTATAGSAGGPPYYHNASGTTYAFWQWKANGGTTSSNTNGTITSTVQANTDAGFSIVTFTGNGSNDATIGHGLGVTPDFIITKNRADSVSWRVWHKDLTSTYVLFLNSNNAETSPTSQGNGYIKTVGSSTYSVYQGTTDTNGVNGSGDNMVAWCFHSVPGFSKIGRYEGNGYNTGPYIYLGFKPAFFMVKSKSSGNWLILDSARDPNNFGAPGGTGTHRLFPNLNNAEDTSETYDFFSNGFQPRKTGALANVGGEEYVYMAFAENPFVTSTGIPTTAR